MLRRAAITLSMLLLVTSCGVGNAETAPSSPTTSTSAPSTAATAASPSRTTESPTPTAVPSAGASAAPSGPSSGWLARLNLLRSSFGVPAVAEDASLTAGDKLHARYVARTGMVTQSEDPDSSAHSEAGALAATTSLVGLGFDTPAQFIDAWAGSPFQLVNLLDSRLTRAGFGIASGPFGTAAALDVVNGRTADPATDGWPRVWPRGRTTVRRLTSSAQPDATSGCPDTGPTGGYGTPILIDFGPTSSIEGATVTITANGGELPTCVHVASDYPNPTASQLMAGKVLIMPLDVLKTGTSVQGTVTTSAGTATIDFAT